MNPKDIALKVAWGFLGKPYVWAGDDPIKGFDCSGFVIEILKSAGILPRKGDWTADQLYEMFKRQGKYVMRPIECGLAFWINYPTASRIRHVEFCISDGFTIGASGGGSNIKTEKDAVIHNAYVKVRPLNFNDKDLFGFVDPFLKVFD